MASFEDFAGIGPEQAASLAAIVAEQSMLYEVVAWMGRHQPTPELVEIVDQDEFTNDVVIALDELWLVYDCS